MTIPRQIRPRRIDDPKLSASELQRAFAGFDRLSRANRVSGKIVSLLRGYAHAQGDLPLRIMNLGSGAGDLLLSWARLTGRAGLAVEVVSLELDDAAIERQRADALAAHIDVEFQQRDFLQGSLPHGFDVIICAQWMHRLDDAHACRLIQSMQLAAAVAVIITDYERSKTNAALLSVASRLVSRSPIVRADTLAGVRSSHTRAEMSDLAQRALARPVEATRVAPFYYLIAIDELVVRVPAPAFA